VADVHTVTISSARTLWRLHTHSSLRHSLHTRASPHHTLFTRYTLFTICDATADVMFRTRTSFIAPVRARAHALSSQNKASGGIGTRLRAQTPSLLGNTLRAHARAHARARAASASAHRHLRFTLPRLVLFLLAFPLYPFRTPTPHSAHARALPPQRHQASSSIAPHFPSRCILVVGTLADVFTCLTVTS